MDIRAQAVPQSDPTLQFTRRAGDRLDAVDRVGVWRRLYLAGLVVAWVGIALVATVPGFSYYRMSLVERAYSPLHDAFKPAGTVGHPLGILGSVMMVVGVSMYALRKRVHVLQRLGKLKYWLEVHIFLCTLGPFLILLHTSMRFGGIVSIAFWSMTAVVASGVIGRYVYARIPKTINGRFLTMQAVDRERGRLVERLSGTAGLTPEDVAEFTKPGKRPEPGGPVRALVLAVRFDLARRHEVHRLRRVLQRRGIPRVMREQLESLVRTRFQLEQQMVLLAPFQRLFRYWHLFHLPLAIVMLIVVLLHIAVAMVFGYV